MGVSLNSCPHFQMGMTRDIGDTIHNNTLPCTPHTTAYTPSLPRLAPRLRPSVLYPCCIYALPMRVPLKISITASPPFENGGYSPSIYPPLRPDIGITKNLYLQ